MPIQESPPTNDNPQTFQTERLQLAIYLHASDGLDFVRCELTGNGKVRFVFRDPNSKAEDLELAFDRGANCAASDLFASQKFLRRKMSEELNKRRIEKYYEYAR